MIEGFILGVVFATFGMYRISKSEKNELIKMHKNEVNQLRAAMIIYRNTSAYYERRLQEYSIKKVKDEKETSSE